MSYDFSRLKIWLKLTAFGSILIQLIYFLIFGELEFLSLIETRNPVIILNVIGAYTGVTALMILINYKKYLLSKISIIIMTYIALFLFITLFFIKRSLIFDSPAANLVTILSVYTLIFAFTYIYKIRIFGSKGVYKEIIQFFIYVSTFNLTLGLGTSALLSLTQVLLSNTMDFDIYRIDLAYGNIAIDTYTYFQTANPFFQAFILETYELLPIFLFLAIIPIVKERKINSLNIWQVIAVPFGLAFIMYSLMPLSGPIYAFSGDYFPYSMPNVVDIIKGMQPIPPANRNGMPSMHLTGALIIFFITLALENKRYFYLSSILVITTAYATLALGEHYLIDLIVALPFATVLAVFLINFRYFLSNNKPYFLYINIVVYIIWMVILINNNLRIWFAEHYLIVIIYSLFSSILAFILAFQYFLTFWKNELYDKIPDSNKNNSLINIKVNNRWVTGIFLASGFAGLMYEVIYAKKLGVIFGGTSVAAYTVLTTYMGGMALGAWLGGYIAGKLNNLIKTYAFLEATIGLYALATPLLFNIIKNIYINISIGISPDSTVLTLWRVILGTLVLGVPTILMGMTLPIMFKFLRHNHEKSDRIISQLYTANIVGASLGALIGGYFIIPAIGIKSATNLTAVISLLICLYALEKMKLKPVVISRNLNYYDVIGKTSNDEVSKVVGISALILVTFGGVITLGLEVVNIHLLAVVAGNSVYAFGLMLFTFLLGLGLGSGFYGFLSKFLSRIKIIFLSQLLLSISILLTSVLWDNLIDYFASFAYIQQFFELIFSARETIRAFVCAIIMLPPAIFIGLSYPAAISLASDWYATKVDDANGVGIASFFNTIGNIVGVLFVGFYLLESVGSNVSLRILSILSFVLSILFLYLIFKERNKINLIVTYSIIAVYIIIYAATPNVWNYQKLSTGANVYFSAIDWGKIIDYSESIEGGVTSVAQQPTGELTLLTNGKFQGNNSGEIEAQKSIALIPIMHTKKRDSALVIGYGTGNSAHIIHEQNFSSLDIVELSPDIVSIADKYFLDINKGVSSKPNTDIYYTDGRNYLLTKDKGYDLISMEITSIWFAGAASLYNKEFYDLANSRLNTDGVLQQWLQLHHIDKIDLIYVLNTVRSSFKYVWLYESGGQGVIVASNSLSAFDTYGSKNKNLIDLKQRLILSPEGVNNINYQIPFSKHHVSNDDNLYLEYSTPKGNAIQRDVLQENIEFLKSFNISN